MTVETASHIDELNDSYPAEADDVSEGAQHLRQLKTVLQTDFPSIDAPVTADVADLNRCDVSTEGTLENSKVATVSSAGVMNCASKSFTNVNIDSGTIDGAVTGATQTPADNSAKLATTAYVDAASGVISVQVKAKNTDETVNNSSTLQDDDDLTWTNIATGIYRMEAFLHVETNNTPDFKHAFDTTNVTGAYSYTFSEKTGTAAAPVADFVNVLTASTSHNFTDGTYTAAGIHIEGMINVSNSTNEITLQWAQDTADASDTNLKAGSWMSLTKENS